MAKENQKNPASTHGTHAERLKRILNWCVSNGLKPSTVGVRSANNSKLIPRLEDRVAHTEKQIAQVEAWIAQRSGDIAEDHGTA